MASSLNLHCLNARAVHSKDFCAVKGLKAANTCSLVAPKSKSRYRRRNPLETTCRPAISILRRAKPSSEEHTGGVFPIAKPFENAAELSDNFVNRVSSYIFRKLRDLFAPVLPKDFDVFSWLPVTVHSRIHKSEYIAILIVREAMIIGFFYAIFVTVDSFCRCLNRLHLERQRLNGESINEEFEASSFYAVRGPIQLVVVLWPITRFIKVVTGTNHFIVPKIRAIGLISAIIWFLIRWKRIVVNHLASKSRIDAPGVFAIDKVASLFLYFLAASSIAEECGLALSSLLAVGGLSGLAVGLAAKEIVSNFFGGTILFMTRPFVIGERITAGSFSGDVQDIGFLHTKLLGFDKVPLLVPNQAFINQVIINFSRAKDKLLDATFQIRHQDIFAVVRITDRVIQYLRWHKDVDKTSQPPICFLKAMGSCGIDIGLMCIIRAPGGPLFFKIQQDILVQVAHIATQEGACFGQSAPFNPIPPVDPFPEDGKC